MSNETVALANVLKMEPSNQAAVIELLNQSTREVIQTLRGWISTRLVASGDGTSVLIYSEWKTEADIARMRSDQLMVAYFPKIRELATFESFQGQVILSENA